MHHCEIYVGCLSCILKPYLESYDIGLHSYCELPFSVYPHRKFSTLIQMSHSKDYQNHEICQHSDDRFFSTGGEKVEFLSFTDLESCDPVDFRKCPSEI